MPLKNTNDWDTRTKKQIRDDRFQEDWGHLTAREQTAIKVALIIKNLALYGLLFSAGAFYGYIRCALGVYC